jgi:phosphinothricin acetyltransferase
MQQRIESICREFPWLVFKQDGEILGYAHASRWKSRPAYRRTAEVTVYTAPGKERQGIGERLCRRLVDCMAKRGYHSLLAGIALPNPASIALHEKLGFEKVAHLKEVGWKSGRWVDVAYWELILSQQATAAGGA